MSKAFEIAENSTSMRAIAFGSTFMSTGRLQEGSLSVDSRRSINCSHWRWSLYEGDSTKYFGNVSGLSLTCLERNKY
jgi:hypothetical protein